MPADNENARHRMAETHLNIAIFEQHLEKLLDQQRATHAVTDRAAIALMESAVILDAVDIFDRSRRQR